MAAAVLCIGLCFYNEYLYNTKGEGDALVAFFALIAAIKVIIN